MRMLLVGVEAVLAVTILISILLQPTKADALSGFIQGKGETFFSKNKGRTREAVLVKLTVISSILFAVNTIVLNIVK